MVIPMLFKLLHCYGIQLWISIFWWFLTFSLLNASLEHTKRCVCFLLIYSATTTWYIATDYNKHKGMNSLNICHLYAVFLFAFHPQSSSVFFFTMQSVDHRKYILRYLFKSFFLAKCLFRAFKGNWNEICLTL